jgi:ABC-type sugar transport system substrate-binding protein
MEQHILEMVNRKVDGLLWVPYWGLGRKGLTLTRKAGIPVIFIDSYQGGLQPQSDEFPNYLSFVGPADETGAYEMGKYLLTHMPAAKDGKKYIAALDGTEGAPTAVLRHKGLVRALKEHSEAVLVSSRNADYRFDYAENCINELLHEFPQLGGVWGANDTMIQGAIQAAKKARRVPGKDIFFVGMDLDSESVKAIRAGDQLYDTGGHWLQLGFGLSTLYDHLNGYSLSKGRSIIKLPLLPLTQDRVNQFEKDFPNGLPPYDFKQKSRTYNPQAPIAFFEMKYSQ